MLATPRARPGSGRPARPPGFTLIEVLAVLLILALVAGVVIPNVGTLAGRQLRQDAQRLQAQLELARQRAIVSAREHQVVLDLDDGSYRMESKQAGAAPEAPPPALPGSRLPVSLAPPPVAEAHFTPLPGLGGRRTRLQDEVFFDRIVAPGGESRAGEVSIAFHADGSTAGYRIFLGDAGGGGLALEVLPLADAVRIRDDLAL